MCLAVPAKIKEIRKESAIVDFGGVTKEISLGIIEGVKPGDYVLVHAGFAIGKLGKEEAEDTLKLLAELKEVCRDEN
ncbi:MAG: HypC/HybG/HupF family hydrogenase formation chaperone [Candidatus Omnitrophota bacterium]